MAMTCRTSDGDLLDTICHNYYGHLRGTVEAVLEANEGLARQPQPYAAGIRIVLPDVIESTDATVQLWS
jgi:phage tail protein X